MVEEQELSCRASFPLDRMNSLFVVVLVLAPFAFMLLCVHLRASMDFCEEAQQGGYGGCSVPELQPSVGLRL